ncbi:hypothetical protein Ancab_037795 [Ancistrocladus abbreviatus]
MGAGISSANSINGDSDDLTPIRLKLGDIPESCIALVLSYLDPADICKLARLNRAFHGASTADFIWESKLPSNYLFIIEKILVDDDDKLIGSWSKKEIFARLSRPVSFDGGTKELWLDKKTGGVCLSISSKALTITGIDDRRYWNHIPMDESRFKTVAYLHQIWWFEVGGELEFKFPVGTYTLFFRLQLGRSSKKRGRRVCDLEQIHGWDIRPVRFQLTTSDGQHAVSQRYLDNPGSWVLYHAGDFVIEDPHRLAKIKFSAAQIDCTHIKGGLCVDSVLIYPKSIAKELGSIL